ncbi:glycosyltransferase [Pseudoroseomonas wenyumeiae]
MVQDGRTGLLVHETEEEGIIASLARNLDQLAEDATMRAAMGRAGQQAVSRSFSVERMVGEFEALYGEVIAAPAGHGWRGVALDPYLRATSYWPRRRSRASA